MSRGDFGYGSTVREYRDDPLRSGLGQSSTESQTGSPRGGRGSECQGHGTYNELVDHISSNIFTINNNATTLDRTTRQIATDKDSVQLRDKIHTTEQNTNRIVTNTTNLFRQLSAVCSRADRQQKLQYERLTSEFRDTLQRYNQLQKKAAERVRTTAPLPNQAKARPSDLINWGDDGRADDEARLIEAGQQRAQLQADEEIIDTDLALIQEREERIRQLESDILDINEIFRDLGTLVHEQGEVVDSIEHNVETAYGHVEAGRDQLSKAATYQSKARKKICCLVITLLIVVAIIALILYFSLRKK